MELTEKLQAVSTATLNMVMYKRGLRSTWMRGPRVMAGEGVRIAGPAFTLSFVPMREDIATLQSYAMPGALRDAIEAAPAGHVVVVDGRGSADSGVIGDILAERLRQRGVCGLVSDAPVRDIEGLLGVGLPIWAPGTVAPPSIMGLSFAGWGALVGCGGVAVAAGDLIVADADGAIVVPADIAAEVAEEGARQDHFERFVQLQVSRGHGVMGLYPPDDAALAAFERWVAAGEPTDFDL